MFLFLIVLFILCLLYIVKVKSSRLCRMVFKFPAVAVELPILGSCLDLLGSPEGTMKTLMQYSENITRAGGAARFYTFNFFCIGLTDASDVAEVLKIYLDKGYLYGFIHQVTGNGSVFAPAGVAKVRRQIITPSFSPRILNSFFEIFCEESIKLTEVLAPHAGAGPFSVMQYLNAWSFDTIIKTMGAKESDEVFYTREFLNAVNKLGQLAHERMISVWLYPNLMHKYSRNYAEIEECSKVLYRNANMVLENRRYVLENYDKLEANSESNKVQEIKVSMFDGLLKSNLNDHEIKEEIIMLIGATDLTGLSIGFTLMLLGLYPTVQDKVFMELQNVFCNSDRPLVRDDLHKLKYLDMVIKESLRLYPPAPFITRKAHTDITLPSGRIIPEGAEVIAAIFGLHRNPKYWGCDATHFDPNRFLPERFQNVHPNAFLPFSYGLRNCIGYKYGQTAMKVCLATILRKYKIVGKSAQGPIPNIKLKFALFLKPVDNFEITIVKRNFQ